MNQELVGQVKANLILAHDADDELIAHLVAAATSYACSFQHLPEDYYEAHEMPVTSTSRVTAPRQGSGPTSPMPPKPCGPR